MMQYSENLPAHDGEVFCFNHPMVEGVYKTQDKLCQQETDAFQSPYGGWGL